MKLLSDYDQWYDGVFDDRPPTFHRLAFTAGGLSKRAQFDLFASLQLPTPIHGTVAELAATIASQRWPGLAAQPPAALRSAFRCVVYLDEHAHRGEGKELLNLEEALARYPQVLASVYVPADGIPAAFRLVRFGRWGFWLRQEGAAGQWQSNRRDREVILEKNRWDSPNPIARVLWAIDFIPSPTGLLAIDFNTAPQLVTLGEAKALSDEEVALELEHVARHDPAHLLQF